MIKFYVVDGFLLTGDFDYWWNIEDLYLKDEEFIQVREVRIGEV